MRYKKLTPEGIITQQIRALLHHVGVFHWKQWQGPMSSIKGIFDIIGIYQSKPLAIEVKIPGKKLSPDQEEFLRKWIAAGGIGFMATSAEEVAEKLGIKNIIFGKRPC